jgi:hypothetical protein
MVFSVEEVCLQKILYQEEDKGKRIEGSKRRIKACLERKKKI